MKLRVPRRGADSTTRRTPRRTSESPLTPPFESAPAQYGVGIQHNVAVPMSDGVELRADIHYPTDTATGQPATGP
ncbi:MAG TPA: peptidase S15, partial [Mycobacterium sp.]